MKQHERIVKPTKSGHLLGCTCGREWWATDAKTNDKYWTAHLPKEKEVK